MGRWVSCLSGQEGQTPDRQATAWLGGSFRETVSKPEMFGSPSVLGSACLEKLMEEEKGKAVL